MIKIWVLSCALSGVFLHGQELNEIINYATEELHGSARYQALGGAFGALGGDLSAISNNPASSTVFSFNEAGVTAGLQTNTNETSYFNSLKSSETNSFDIVGQLLVVCIPHHIKSKNLQAL